MTLKHDIGFKHIRNPDAKLVLRANGTIEMTPEMEPIADEVLDIIFSYYKDAMENSQNVNARPRRSDFDQRVVTEIVETPLQEVDTRKEEIWW